MVALLSIKMITCEALLRASRFPRDEADGIFHYGVKLLVGATTEKALSLSLDDFSETYIAPYLAAAWSEREPGQRSAPLKVPKNVEGAIATYDGMTARAYWFYEVYTDDEWLRLDISNDPDACRENA